jgi:fatty-acyl-CoA synthase
VSGRVNDLIIVNGRNFYAHDIEAAVSGVPGIKPGRAVAFAISRDTAGSDGAVVLAKTTLTEHGDTRALAGAISKAVFDVLGLTVHHVGIRPLGFLVKTTSGKLSRSENGPRFAEETRL